MCSSTKNNQKLKFHSTLLRHLTHPKSLTSALCHNVVVMYNTV